MICKCGYALPAALATTPGFRGLCPSCNKTLRHSTEEVLSRPELGVVKEIRPGQIELATIIDKALNSQTHQIVFAEGGCGLGKTYSYNVPALLRGRRYVVCTAKKSLQDQLEADVPRLINRLGLPQHTFVSVKGKANYCCRRMLKKNKELFDRKGKSEVWERLTKWLEEEPHGDLNEFGDDEFPISTCTADECVGRSCRYRDTCGYLVTKMRVREATVVVTNHSLIGYDLRLGVGRLFGEYDTLIVDEGHSFAENVRKSFSEDVSDAWLGNFLGRLGRENFPITGDTRTMDADWEHLFKEIPEQKLLEPGFIPQATLDTCFTHIDALDKDFMTHFTNVAGVRITNSSDMVVFEEEGFRATLADEDAEDLDVLLKLYNKMHEKRQLLLSTQNPADNVINCREETRNGHIKLMRQPVNLGPLLRTPFGILKNIVITSATLNFDLVKGDLGVEPSVEISAPSPFNYKQNGIMYLPKHLPRPGEPGFIKAVGDEVVQLVRLSEGNTLVLFTSLKELQEVHEYINDNYELEYPLLAQLPGRKAAELFTSFMATDKSILLGSKSFFEGIDIPGDKLRLVIIVKIPFPQQDDPLSKAQERLLGPSMFWSKYYFPKMQMDLRQAVGRLIRTATDKGVVAILDSRIWVAGRKDLDPKTVGTSKVPWTGYGFKIIKSLPFEQYTPNIARVKDFFDLILKRS
jgi:ATP-dependent DNA helicase DinG